jgi:hypothetical protein
VGGCQAVGGMVGASLLRDMVRESGEGLTTPGPEEGFAFDGETGWPQLRQKRAFASRGMLQRVQFMNKNLPFALQIYARMDILSQCCYESNLKC